MRLGGQFHCTGSVGFADKSLTFKACGACSEKKQDGEAFHLHSGILSGCIVVHCRQVLVRYGDERAIQL
jgi:hypothetical protein